MIGANYVILQKREATIRGRLLNVGGVRSRYLFLKCTIIHVYFCSWFFPNHLLPWCTCIPVYLDIKLKGTIQQLSESSTSDFKIPFLTTWLCVIRSVNDDKCVLHMEHEIVRLA